MKIEDILFEKTSISEAEFNEIKETYELRERDFSFKETNDGIKVYSPNFVGFIINDEGKILISFPLNYSLNLKDKKEVINAATKIMRTINKHNTTSKDFYLSQEGDRVIDTNYPFDAFFRVYDYFSKYGLHFSFQKSTSSKPSNKVNWKKTIKETNFYISNQGLVFFPFYYDHKYRADTFITYCMVDSINTTLRKYGFFIGLNDTGIPTPDFNLDNTYIVQELNRIQFSVFNETEKQLIDNLITFYSEIDSYTRNNIYFKHYSYYDVWEKMVYHYLDYHFDSIDSTKNLKYKHSISPRGFQSQKRFYPNDSYNDQYMDLDFYLAEEETQYIFDAKYKVINNLDYKQLGYYFLLKEYVPDYIMSSIKEEDKEELPAYYKQTYSVMFTPYNKWEDSIVHFTPKLQFSRENEEMYILEDRMFINDVIDYWLE